jgi:hypothetical protein
MYAVLSVERLRQSAVLQYDWPSAVGVGELHPEIQLPLSSEELAKTLHDDDFYQSIVD